VFEVPKAKKYVYGLSKSEFSMTSSLSDTWLRIFSHHDQKEVRRRKLKYLEIHAQAR